MKHLVLTPSLRRRLKRPVGRLFRGSEVGGVEFRNLVDDAKMVVTVGDKVTETLDRLGRTPEVQVVDEVERRVKRQAPRVPYAHLYEADNPAGLITRDSIKAITLAFRGMFPSRVLITGEEDLLVLPVIEEAPMGSVVFYGQPKEGVVAVKVDARARASAERLLDAMGRLKRSGEAGRGGGRRVPKRRGPAGRPRVKAPAPSARRRN